MFVRTRLWMLVAVLAGSLAATPALAQESASSNDGAAESSSSSSSAESASEKAGDDSGTKKDSAHGSYEWKPSYGGGIEYGLFFTGLERWNAHVLEPNDAEPFEGVALSSFTLAAEASVLEGSRFTVFGGLESPFSDAPNVRALYGGVEPAFAFRRDMWEMALGIGVGIGGLKLTAGGDRELNSGVVVLRPTVEVRRYVNEWSAGYARIGFNQWLPYNASSDSLDISVRENAPAGEVADESDLQEGGIYVALGVRFGHYPKHVAVVPDTDGDTIRDDVDECVDKPEDQDGFEDADGCPDPDNDGDGIEDEQDECPDKAEDKDGFEDEDGCPDEAGDSDRDGIIDEKDECPEKAEDEDGFEDDDGCPDPDNDGDTVPDTEDECPEKKGIPSKNGCPSDIVEVQEQKLLVSKPLQFESTGDGEEAPRTTLSADAKSRLDVVAEVLGVYTEITKLEIQAHTDEGDEKAKQKESTERAQAVKDYLVSKGVDGGRLVAKGYGDSKPVAAGETEKGEKPKKSPSSRIEFHIRARSEAKSDSSSSGSTETDAGTEGTGGGSGSSESGM